MPLPRIMVAPNGARLTQVDHPALPVTNAEVVACAVECFAAGADGLHAHIRDDAGRHLLGVDVYRSLLADLRRAVPDMAIQITTEAVGVYEPDLQMKVALEAGADLVSVAVREISRAGLEETRAFYATCADRGIEIQHILYDEADCRLLEQYLPPDLFRRSSLQLLFVLGRYSEGGASSADELQPFLDWMQAAGIDPDWAVCAFGEKETECLVAAAAAGGKCRVGFENSRILSTGAVAESNAQKVADLRAALSAALPDWGVS